MHFDLKDVADLARAVGIFGAFVLIIAVGIAWHLPKVLGVVRQILKDFQDHSRKTRELEHRIKRESARIDLEIESKRKQVEKDR